jgi:hypothetical protein
MLPGHIVASEACCNVALTCAAPVEPTLYRMSKSAISLPLAQLNKGLCSVCSVEQVLDGVLKQQGGRVNTAKGWSVYPLCQACALRGVEAESVHQTKAQSKRSVRGLHWPHKLDTKPGKQTVHEAQHRLQTMGPGGTNTAPHEYPPLSHIVSTSS